MEAILIGLALAAIVISSLLFAVLVAGIRREEHDASLTCRPAGLSAALARRVLGVYSRTPADPDHFDQQGCETSLTPDGEE